MKDNELRPFFRFLAAVLSLLSYIGALFAGYSFLTSSCSTSAEDWGFVLGLFVCGLACSFIAMTGYVPERVWRFMNRWHY